MYIQLCFKKNNATDKWAHVQIVIVVLGFDLWAQNKIVMFQKS